MFRNHPRPDIFRSFLSTLVTVVHNLLRLGRVHSLSKLLDLVLGLLGR